MSTPPDRPYGELLRRLGIKGAGDFNIGRQVVPTLQADDTRGLLAPLDRIVTYGRHLQAAVAAQFSHVNFITGGEGYYLLSLTASVLAYFWIDNAPSAVAGAVAFNAMRFGHTDAETDALSGTLAAASFPAGAYLASAGAVPDIVWPPDRGILAFVPRGRTLHVEAVVANTALSVAWGIMEVPRQGVVSNEW